jgi:hypothetical protein
MLWRSEQVELWLAMLWGGRAELGAIQANSAWRKWRRLTLRIASLIMSEKMNQHCYATMKLQLPKLEQGVVVEAVAKLTSVRAVSGGGGGRLLGCRGGSGSFLGRHLAWCRVGEIMDGERDW